MAENKKIMTYPEEMDQVHEKIIFQNSARSGIPYNHLKNEILLYQDVLREFLACLVETELNEEQSRLFQMMMPHADILQERLANMVEILSAEI